MQKELASLAESVADRLHASEESRNLLIEQTREFKKNSSEVNWFIVMHPELFKSDFQIPVFFENLCSPY